MDKQQAWELLVQATAAVSANREVHEKIKEALGILKPVEPKEE